MSYWLSIILVSLALYGLWHVFRDFVGLWFTSSPTRPLTASLLVIVRNAEATVEWQVRQLLYKTALDPVWQEVVVVDHGSDDLTPAILARLAVSYPMLKIVHLPFASRPMAEAMAFCQGEVVQILDMVNRLGDEDWDAAVRLLMR